MGQDSTASETLIKKLLPQPRQGVSLDRGYALRPEVTITLTTPPAQADERAARLLEALLADQGIASNLEIRTGSDWQLDLGEPEAEAETTGDLPDEGYTLTVNDRGARFCAPSAQGLYWGVMTLRQLLVRDGNQVSLAGVRITDWPRYRWRGFMIDAGRSPCSVGQFKRIIRIASAFKLNCVVYREGDDELNAVRYETLPLGHLNPRALTMAQIREISAYATACGITLIPEIESLGHSTAKGFHYPYLVEGGFAQPYPGLADHTRKSHLNPADERSYDLLAAMYDEWFTFLPSPLLHLGLDEVRLPMETQTKHLARLLPLVMDVGQRYDLKPRPIVWADAPATPTAYADRVIRCLWTYHNRPVSDTTPHLVEQGIQELSQPGCETPVFMAGGSGSRHEPYTKGNYEAALNNLADWARWGRDLSNVIGLVAVQWHGNMLDDWLPDFLAAADFGWHPPEHKPAHQALMARIQGHLNTLRDVTDPDPDEVDPPAWDGIWLRDGTWYEDIMSGMRAKTNDL